MISCMDIHVYMNAHFASLAYLYINMCTLLLESMSEILQSDGSLCGLVLRLQVIHVQTHGNMVVHTCNHSAVH